MNSKRIDRRLQSAGGGAPAPETPAKAASDPKSMASSGAANQGRRGSRLLKPSILGALGLLVVGLIVAADWWFCLPEVTQPRFVGRQSCIQCHQQQHELFQGSHHDLAMDLATEETVLGDFNDAELEHYGISSRMFRRDGKFMVHTEGPDGEMADFAVQYVFGVMPLQQYMVEFDRPDDMPEHQVSRVQVLRISWDTLGKKWFHLDPPDVQEKLDPGDDLHWTGVAQRWNNMCADCHSTDVRKNFDPRSGRYHTTFNEIDVSCEACHGPASLHVELANARSLFWDRKRGYGLARLKDEDNNKQIESCAQCHARRRVMAEGYHAGETYYDHFATEFIQPLLYHSDGQILDEVYVHGSFLQSQMHAKGVRCTDCHDPHTARLKHDGNQLCTSCHQKQHPAAKYDSPSHHFHGIGSRGASCVECHMPSTTYMEVDDRRDHSFRSPRPDLSLLRHTPNACTRCHLEMEKEQALQEVDEALRPRLKQYNDWIQAAHPFTGPSNESAARVLQRVDRRMADAIQGWYGAKEQPASPSLAFDLSWRGDPNAYGALEPWLRSRATPAILRASGWASRGSLAAPTSSDRQDSLDRLLAALGDPHPLVRAAAVARLEEFLPSRLDAPQVDQNPLAARQVADQIGLFTEPLLPLLNDATRMVRVEAARVMARIPRSVLPLVTRGSQREAFDTAFDELVAYLILHRDRAGSIAALANLQEFRGDDRQAERLYREAIALEPGIVGLRANLAALFERQAEQAEQDVRQALARRDQASAERLARTIAAHQADAQELRVQELPLLARDVRLAPNNAHAQHRYGLALYLQGDTVGALDALRRAYELESHNDRFLLMLVLLHQRLGEFEQALALAEELVTRAPEQAALLEDIRQAIRAPQQPQSP